MDQVKDITVYGGVGSVRAVSLPLTYGLTKTLRSTSAELWHLYKNLKQSGERLIEKELPYCGKNVLRCFKLPMYSLYQQQPGRRQLTLLVQAVCTRWCHAELTLKDVVVSLGQLGNSLKGRYKSLLSFHLIWGIPTPGVASPVAFVESIWRQKHQPEQLGQSIKLGQATDQKA